MITLLIELAISVLVLIAGWKMYEKAGKPGWAYIIPIYNLMVMMEIIGKPKFWWLWLLVPFYNIYIWYKISQGLARSYGLSDGYTWLCFFLPCIFFLIVGFKSDIVYAGPSYDEAK